MADNFPKPILPFLEGKIGELRKMRFWSNVDMRGPDECWDWLLSAKRRGYGRFKIASYDTVSAHRFALICTTGKEPSGMYVLHSCDRPICCNPHHLRFGTASENAKDKYDRGRQRFGNHKGVMNPNSKLDTEQLAEVIRMMRAGMNNKQIAAKLPVGHSLVSRIRVGRSWAVESAKLGWHPKKQFNRTPPQEKRATS